DVPLVHEILTPSILGPGEEIVSKKADEVMRPDFGQDSRLARCKNEIFTGDPGRSGVETGSDQEGLRQPLFLEAREVMLRRWGSSGYLASYETSKISSDDPEGEDEAGVSSGDFADGSEIEPPC